MTAVICETGGRPCLDAYVENMKIMDLYEMTYNINDVVYKFIVDPLNGMVYADQTFEIICYEGGRTCLNEHVDSLKFTLSTVNGIDFRIYKTGRVTDDTGKEICKTGGYDCIL